jgi:hypothetical protein
MTTDERLNKISAQLADLQKQVSLIQSVLLELTRSAGKAVGNQSPGQVTGGPVTGCEDQCTEPQG